MAGDPNTPARGPLEGAAIATEHGEDARHRTSTHADLVRFTVGLLEHPHRLCTTARIAGCAWSDPALLPEEVRNHVTRVRRILARLEIPRDLVNRPGRGCSLTFRNADRPARLMRALARPVLVATTPTAGQEN